jgi:pimeloyl-ACP methyl ester carboxylesterase
MEGREALASLVFVHGGLHGAWCWERVLPHLIAAGHEAIAIDLPGADGVMAAATVTLDRYRDALLGEIAGRSSTPILVGHSLGGRTVSAAAEARPDRVRALVYLAALVPQIAGQAPPPVPGKGNVIREGFVPTADGASVTISRAAAMEGFYSGTAADDAERAYARLVPQPLGPMRDPLVVTRERWGSVPAHYILTLQDRGIPVAAQRAMAAAMPGVVTHELRSDHSPFYSCPEELVRILLQIADG